jgi:hypothetical protein
MPPFPAEAAGTAFTTTSIVVEAPVAISVQESIEPSEFALFAGVPDGLVSTPTTEIEPAGDAAKPNGSPASARQTTARTPTVASAEVSNLSPGVRRTLNL